MKTNEFIIARTHAEFLNQLLHRNYKAFMQCGLTLPDGKWLWMIKLSHKPSGSGWINMLIDDKLSEEFVGKEFQFNRHNTYIGTNMIGQHNLPWYPYRVVFDIIQFDKYRKYVFKGVFLIDEENSTLKKNVWTRISNNYEFN
ncbi:MAG: hypothetical protein IKB02_02485 [Clostridia bacterium]|nr:hypothetical protein [Clostridia bacterium]